MYLGEGLQGNCLDVEQMARLQHQSALLTGVHHILLLLNIGILQSLFMPQEKVLLKESLRCCLKTLMPHYM